jgi:TDG/mug DNA glycosylase family protein
MTGLRDIIDFNLQILFIGYNPGLKSAATGHHYAGSSNNFWKLLLDSGITPYRFKPEEDSRLLELGIGSTNIIERPTKSASELTREEFRSGREKLKLLLSAYKPKIACYVGLGVYKEFSGCKPVKCGLQAVNMVEGVLDYVCPSPSGLNRMPYSKQLECFRGLNELKEIMR